MACSAFASTTKFAVGHQCDRSSHFFRHLTGVARRRNPRQLPSGTARNEGRSHHRSTGSVDDARRAGDRTIRVKRWYSLVSLNIIGHMLRSIGLFVVLTATALAQEPAKDEAQVWQLEKAYWESVCVIHATLGYSGDRVAG